MDFTTWMVAPEKIQLVDGKAIFMWDCTGDWRWGFDPDSPGRVFDAERHASWELHSEEMDQFLVHRTVWEVLHSASTRMRATGVSESAVAAITASAEEVQFGAWRWPVPGYRIFMQGDVLIQVVCDDDEDPEWDVDIAAPAPAALADILALPDVEWRR
ncbi:hypothetical protein ACFY0N_04620 [Streptomyces vinaceus]|uniref:hypothetical protein n=1 Tax=Streptomyces vinaceus TaxID=1960 RepID=UPI00369AA439